MRVRQRAITSYKRSFAMQRAVLGFICLVLLGLGASTCGYADAVLVACSDSEDCNGYPGTVCAGEMCVCTSADLQFCYGACRPIAECEQGSGATGSAGGAGGAGGMSGGTIECATAADCKQPGDPRCGTATCTNGVCSLEFKPLSKLKSQIAGDCHERWCDGQGNLVEYTEASDIYQDGLPCVNNSCEAGTPVSTLVPKESVCPVVNAGVCYEGACVPCIQGAVNCGGGLICQGTVCVPPHCINSQWDQGSGETGYNCGGSCTPCFTGNPCKVGSDCLSGVCAGGTCQPATCSDGVRNDSETGADCGGPLNCPRCAAGQGCKLPSDCLSGVCWAGVCNPPTCTDGLKNGDETGEDCGGPCAACP